MTERVLRRPQQTPPPTGGGPDPREEEHVRLSPRTPGLISMTPDHETEPRMPSGRRLARAAAAQAVYEMELTGHPVSWAVRHISEREGMRADQADFARRLAEDVERRRSHIDALIAKLAPERPVSRIDAVDLAVLRVAVAELTAEWPEMTPPSVVVDEAVELARLFGAEHSPRFVNGALGAMLR